MKALILVAVFSSLLASCGELNPAMSPSVTTVGCAAQTAGSTVTIFDQIQGCSSIDSKE